MHLVSWPLPVRDEAMRLGAQGEDYTARDGRMRAQDAIL